MLFSPLSVHPLMKKMEGKWFKCVASQRVFLRASISFTFSSNVSDPTSTAGAASTGAGSGSGAAAFFLLKKSFLKMPLTMLLRTLFMLIRTAPETSKMTAMAQMIHKRSKLGTQKATTIPASRRMMEPMKIG